MTHYKAEGANGTNVGSRMYLLEDESNYKMFNLLNKEFTFTIDTSNLPCGLNGALYFVEMQKSRHVTPYLTPRSPRCRSARSSARCSTSRTSSARAGRAR